MDMAECSLYWTIFASDLSRQAMQRFLFWSRDIKSVKKRPT